MSAMSLCQSSPSSNRSPRLLRSHGTLAILLIGVLITGCGESDDAIATPAPESFATPAAVVVPAGMPGQPEIAARDLAPAHAKTRAVTTYRIQFDFETGTDDPGTSTTQPYIKFDGEILGSSNHILYDGGAFTEMLGNASRVEVITVGDNTFLKGSRLFGIGDDQHWYRMQDSGLSKPPFEVDDLLQLIGDDVTSARATGTVPLDGQSCQTYSINVKSAAGPLTAATAPQDQPPSVSVVDSAEARFAACTDGFVHQMEWNVLSHDSSNAADKSSIRVMVHLYDFNAANIKITAPPDALEIK